MSASIPIPNVPISEEHVALFKSVNAFVHDYMSQPGHDNSHDYVHILRVLSNAHTLLQAELKANPASKLDASVIYLAALLHDVGDHKYAKPGEDPERQVFGLMRERGASDELASKVQSIVKHVSYSNEVKNPQSVVDVLSQHPELGIVQDADRLDAIGAVGIGRCFAFGGAKGNGRPLSGAIDHFEEKLVKLPDMMKTAAGRNIAVSRRRILEDFAAQFQKEAQLSFTLN